MAILRSFSKMGWLYVLDAYGDLDLNSLLMTVYDRCQAYAKKSFVRRPGSRR